MSYIFMAHRIVGSMVLPLLLLLAAIWFTATWKPSTWPSRSGTPVSRADRPAILARPGLLDRSDRAGGAAYYLAFPFLLHPIAGLIATVVAQLLVRPNAISARLGRWTPLLSFVSILVLVMGAVFIVNNV